MRLALRKLLRQRWPFSQTKTICCIGKGGAGKSTTTAQLAVIAASKGLNVLVLDCDRQQSVSTWSQIRGADPRITVRQCSYNEIERICRAGQSEGFDLVLIDHPQQPGDAWPGLVRATDLFVLLSRPSVFDLKTAHAWLNQLNASGNAAHIVVISSAPPRRNLADNPYVRDGRSVLAVRTAAIWSGQLTHRASLVAATAAGKGVIECEPLGAASAEYVVLWHRLLARLKAGGAK